MRTLLKGSLFLLSVCFVCVPLLLRPAHAVTYELIPGESLPIQTDGLPGMITAWTTPRPPILPSTRARRPIVYL